MPSAEAALRALLTAGSPNAVAAIVGTRVYPDYLPQGVVWPAIRYQRISTPRSRFRDVTTGKAQYATPRFQIDCWAVTSAGALALATAVYELLEGYRGTVAGLRIDAISTEDQASDPEEGLFLDAKNIHRQRIDVFIAHPEITIEADVPNMSAFDSGFDSGFG